MRWRRLCVDVNEDDAVIGASVEFYEDFGRGPDQVAVLARGEWTGLEPHELLEVELGLPWHQPTLPINWLSYTPGG